MNESKYNDEKITNNHLYWVSMLLLLMLSVRPYHGMRSKRCDPLNKINNGHHAP